MFLVVLCARVLLARLLVQVVGGVVVVVGRAVWVIAMIVGSAGVSLVVCVVHVGVWRDRILH